MGIGYGSKLEINDGASSAFVEVTGLVTVKPPAESVGSVQSKRLNGTNRTITYLAGLNDPEQFTYTYEFSKAEFDRHELLRRDATTNAPLSKNFKVTIEDGATDFVRTVPGLVLKNEIDTVSADEIMMVNVTVQVTGAAV